MNSEHQQPSNLQRSVQQQPNRQPQKSLLELATELEQKRQLEHKLSKEAKRRTAEVANLEKLFNVVKSKVITANAMKNDVITTYNDIADVCQRTMQLEGDVEKKVGAIEQYISNKKKKKHIDEEIRQLEEELAKLPSESELQKNAEEKRQMQQQIDDTEREMAKIEKYLAENDDAETLQQKIEEKKRSIAIIQAELKADESQVVAKQPKAKTNAKQSDSKAELDKFVAEYFSRTSSGSSTHVTTRIDSVKESTNYHLGSSDDSSS